MGMLLTGCGKPAENPLANVTTRTAPPLQTEMQPERTVTANPDPTDFRSLFDASHRSVPISAEGVIYGTEDAVIYEQPDSASRQLSHLPAGVKIRAVALTVTGQHYLPENRWLRVRTNNLEGYLPAQAAAVRCSTPYDELDSRQRAALGIMMYYQSMQLFLTYQREGGMDACGRSGEFDAEGYERLLPEGLTLKQLRTSFHGYFAEAFPDDFDQTYQQKDGGLWVLTGYGDNVSLDYTEIYLLTAQGSDTLIYDTRAHLLPGYNDVSGGSEWQKYPFMLVFENGYWKTAEMTELY